MIPADLRKKAPLLGVAISLVCGVLFYDPEYRDNTKLFFWGEVVGWSVLLVYHFVYRKEARKWTNFLFRVLVYLLFVATAWILAAQHDRSNEARQLVVQQEQWVRFLISDPPQNRGSSVRVDGVLTHVMQGGAWKEVNLGCRMYFKELQPNYGEVWMLRARLSLPDSAVLPWMFDLRSYLFYKGIFLTARTNKDAAHVWAFNQGSWFQNLALRIRSESLEAMNVMGRDSITTGVIKALVLGYRNDLDEGITDSFSKTGVIHVLAVSGMHVGIVYIVLAFLLRPLRRLKWGHKIESIVVILFLWLFALVTGFTPSVNRAALMFTVVQLGYVLLRRSHILNSLSFAGILMILFNPWVIYQPGFQLSFAAVLGIVIGAESLTQWFRPSDWLGQKAVELGTVSLSAQLATFPLTLAYFHQISLVFLLANLVVLPFIPFIIYISIASLGVWQAGFHEVGVFMFQRSEDYVVFLQSVVSFLDSWEWSSLERVFLSRSQVILLYLFMLLLTISNNLRLKFLLPSLSFLMLCYALIEMNHVRSRKEFRGIWELSYYDQKVLIMANTNGIRAYAPVNMLLRDPYLEYYTSGLQAYLGTKTQSFPFKVLNQKDFP